MRTLFQRILFGAALLAALTTLAEPALAQPYRRVGYGLEENAFRVRGGLLRPRGDSEYWDDKELDFTGDAGDFEDFTLGLEYVRRLGPRLGLLFGGDLFEGEARQSFRDFVDQFGRPIRHRTTLDLVSVQLGLLLHLASPRAAVRPYVGGGGGLYFYRLEESGDFIDFFFEPPVIFTDTFRAEGEALGYFFLVGFEVPVAPSFGIFAEGRWHRADDDLGEDFEGFGTLDLSSRQVTGGLSWSF